MEREIAYKCTNGFVAYATVNSDLFKPTKFGGKYTVTLIPGMHRQKNKAL